VAGIAFGGGVAGIALGCGGCGSVGIALGGTLGGAAGSGTFAGAGFAGVIGVTTGAVGVTGAAGVITGPAGRAAHVCLALEAASARGKRGLGNAGRKAGRSTGCAGPGRGARAVGTPGAKPWPAVVTFLVGVGWGSASCASRGYFASPGLGL